MLYIIYFIVSISSFDTSDYKFMPCEHDFECGSGACWIGECERGDCIGQLTCV